MTTKLQRVDLSYRLTFLAPFHCGSGVSAGLLDRIVRRDDAGYLCIPGSTVKGVVRQACERLSTLLDDYLSADLGTTSDVLRADSPHDEGAALRDFSQQTTLVARLFGSRVRPGSLFFDTAEMTQEWKDFFASNDDDRRYQSWQTEERTQVTMARPTTTARPGLLFTSEYGLRCLTFNGRIYGTLEDWEVVDSVGSYALALLLAGLSSVDRIGAQRSSGFGQCTLAVTTLTIDGVVVDNRTDYLQQLDDIVYYVWTAEEQ